MEGLYWISYSSLHCTAFNCTLHSRLHIIMLDLAFCFSASICAAKYYNSLLLQGWLQRRSSAKRSGRTMWTGAVVCLLEQKPWLSGPSVCRDRAAATCKGWQRGHCWECGRTSQPRENGQNAATHRKDSQIMNHYTLVNVPPSQSLKVSLLIPPNVVSVAWWRKFFLYL